MVMGFGKVCMGIPILGNGEKVKLRGMEFIIGRMGIGMKENGGSV